MALDFFWPPILFLDSKTERLGTQRERGRDSKRKKKWLPKKKKKKKTEERKCRENGGKGPISKMMERDLQGRPTSSLTLCDPSYSHLCASLYTCPAVVFVGLPLFPPTNLNGKGETTVVSVGLPEIPRLAGTLPPELTHTASNILAALHSAVFDDDALRGEEKKQRAAVLRKEKKGERN
jgi:hypothetical protein